MKRYIALFLSIMWMLPLFACSGEEETMGERPSHGVATVNAVGDIFLTDVMLSDAKRSDGSYQFLSQFENVIVALSQADVTLGNFEGNFIGSDFGNENGSYPNELATELSRIGFDILQTANSYSIFNGLSGLQSTKAAIESNGMRALGTYTSTEDRSKNQVILQEINGVRIAFVAFTKGLGNLMMPSDTQCGVDLLYEDYTTNYSQINESHITSVLKKAKESKPDVIIAALHWGSENNAEVSQSQKDIADLMLKNGVDVIVGSHSHLVGKIERRSVTRTDGTKKDCVIAYSLGDFCVAQKGKCNTSLILNLEFTRNGDVTSITKVDYTPVSTVDLGTSHADRYCVMMTQAEVELYESNYYERVSTQLYEIMLSDLETIRKKVGTDE